MGNIIKQQEHLSMETILQSKENVSQFMKNVYWSKENLQFQWYYVLPANFCMACLICTWSISGTGHSNNTQLM